jgi:hypothetical protein
MGSGSEVGMKEIFIKSHIITGLAYDASRNTLKLVFKNSQVRLFSGVPANVVGELVAAPSPGQFYIDHIRKNFTRLAA